MWLWLDFLEWLGKWWKQVKCYKKKGFLVRLLILELLDQWIEKVLLRVLWRLGDWLLLRMGIQLVGLVLKFVLWWWKVKLGIIWMLLYKESLLGMFYYLMQKIWNKLLYLRLIILWEGWKKQWLGSDFNLFEDKILCKKLIIFLREFFFELRCLIGRRFVFFFLFHLLFFQHFLLLFNLCG